MRYSSIEAIERRRRNLRIILFVIIMATLPFYCVGIGLFLTSPIPGTRATATSTAPTASWTPIGLDQVTATLRPSITPLFSPTPFNALQPTPFQFFTPIFIPSPTPIIVVTIPTSTPAPTLTPIPTNTPPPTNTIPPTATETPFIPPTPLLPPSDTPPAGDTKNP